MNLSNARVAVSGGGGFLGQAVVAELQRHGCLEVAAPPSRSYDLRTESGVEGFYCDLQPDVVIHLAAAVGGIAANQAEPGRYFYDNAIMALQMLEYARRYGIEKFVGIGTVCAYPKFCPLPFEESCLWDGYPEETNAPYGLAKKMMLVQSQAYREQYDLNAIHLVMVNLYGPADDFSLERSHVIGALIRKFVEAQHAAQDSVTLWGDGSPTREFLFVRDAARAVVLAAEHYDGADPVNIGSGQEVSIADLADRIRRIVGFEGHILWDTSRPNGQPRRCLNVQRAEVAFGFRADTPLEQGLRDTCQWYMGHRPAQLIGGSNRC